MFYKFSTELTLALAKMFKDNKCVLYIRGRSPPCSVRKKVTDNKVIKLLFFSNLLVRYVIILNYL